MTEMECLQKKFGLSEVILIGDQGMLIHTDIEKLRAMDKVVHWITALQKASVREMSRTEALVFAEESIHLCEIHHHHQYPDERLIACQNTSLAKSLHQKRGTLLKKTEEGFADIQDQIHRQILKGRVQMALAVGKVMQRCRKVQRYFEIEITHQEFTCSRREDLIEEDRRLDGISVLRTSLPAVKMSAEDCVRSYQSLAWVEKAFRRLKADGWQISAHHCLSARVRCHFFLCALSYHVEWYMRYAWRGFTYADPHVFEHTDGEPLQTSRSLLWSLSTVTKQICSVNYSHLRVIQGGVLGWNEGL